MLPMEWPFTGLVAQSPKELSVIRVDTELQIGKVLSGVISEARTGAGFGCPALLGEWLCR